MKKYTTKEAEIPVSTPIAAEPVDQNATQPQPGLSFSSRYYFHYVSLAFSLSEFNKFTPILRGMVKVILGNVGNQYLKLKYTSQVEGKWVH